MRSWNFSLTEQARATDAGAHFVQYFGGRQRLRDIGTWQAIRTRFPKAATLDGEAGQLSGSGHRFPLLVRDPGDSAKELISVLLGVDRASLPEGWTAQLMPSNADRLSEGAEKAAWQTIGAGSPPVEASVASAPGRTVPMTGFYAYGELSTPARSGPVELHNQTMTVLTLTETPA